MWATPEGPRLEDFGITADDLERAPRPVLSKHRFTCVAVVYVLAAVVVFTHILRVSQSLPAAAFFTIITLAAGSVLLLPALVFVLCIGERAEERWLCQKVPALAACLAYRRAVAEHLRSGTAVVSSADSLKNWTVLSREVAIELVKRELDHRFGPQLAAANREATGFDFMVELDDRLLLIRCEPGSEAVESAVGRELVAGLSDFNADGALILTASGATPALRRYISGRPIEIATPTDLYSALTEVGRDTSQGSSFA